MDSGWDVGCQLSGRQMQALVAAITAGKAQYPTVEGPTKPTSIMRFATFPKRFTHLLL